MKFFLTIILLFAPLFLQSADWTLFFYMGADNGLHQYALNDIVEMQKGLLNGHNSLDIIVYIDHAPHHKNGSVEYLQIRPSAGDAVASNILRSFPDENSGSPETLTRFLNWAYPRYASQKNILVIWSHGTGWSRSSEQTTWIIEDDTSQSNIKVYSGELHNALARHGQKYDIIILDACHSGSIELVTEIKDFAGLIIASPDTFPSLGFPWTEIISRWQRGLSSIQVSDLLASNFADAYTIGGVYNHWGTGDFRVSVSVYDMAKYDRLFEALQNFSNRFASSEYASMFSSSRAMTPGYGGSLNDIDLLYFADVLRKQSAFDEPVTESLYHATDEFVINKKSLLSDYHHSISIFYPRYFEDFIGGFYRYWHLLKFSKSDWGRFLNYVYGVDTHPPDPVLNLNHTINLETIYIYWDKPIDPTPLTYRVLFYDERNNILHSLDSIENKTSTKINFNGIFSVESIDETGNFSSPVWQNFSFVPVENARFYIAPNPVQTQKNEFFVFYYLTRYTRFVNLSIYNVSGQLIWEEQIGARDRGEDSIVVRNLSTGMYFGVLTTENERLVDRFAIIR